MSTGKQVAWVWIAFAGCSAIWIVLMVIAPGESMKSADTGWNSITVFFCGLFVLAPLLFIAIVVTLAGVIANIGRSGREP